MTRCAERLKVGDVVGATILQTHDVINVRGLSAAAAAVWLTCQHLLACVTPSRAAVVSPGFSGFTSCLHRFSVLLGVTPAPAFGHDLTAPDLEAIGLSTPRHTATSAGEGVDPPGGH